MSASKMKQCSKCKQEKDAEAFSKNARACRECENKRKVAYRLAHPEKERERKQHYRRENKDKVQAYNRLPHRRASNNAVVIRWRNRNPDRIRAHYAVKHAIKTGKLKSQPCWVCGGKAEAHHASYARDARLDVTWLCDAHHAQVHSEARTPS